MTDHNITCTDEQVRGHAGTTARCSCGWYDSWGVRDGSAEASSHEHMRTNDPEYRAKSDEQRLFWPTAIQDHNRAEPLTGRPPEPERSLYRHCHDCSCFISPPCNQCVDCRHVDIDDCPNDCHDCEIDHEA